MIVYYSGIQKGYLEDIPPKTPVLVSFDSKSQCKLIPELHQNGYPVFLDSGAFSVYNSGRKPINLNDYIQFLFSVIDKIDGAISLDVINGTIQENINNLLEIKKHQCLIEKLWPVFHQGDSWGLMDSYIDLGFKNIAIAGTTLRGKPRLLKWVDEVFLKYSPNQINYHGLGMTQPLIFEDYRDKFKSVDSIRWLAFQKYGLLNNQSLLDSLTRHDLYEIMDDLPVNALRRIGLITMQKKLGLSPEKLKDMRLKNKEKRIKKQINENQLNFLNEELFF